MVQLLFLFQKYASNAVPVFLRGMRRAPRPGNAAFAKQRS
jgi:hypothetical protein